MDLPAAAREAIDVHVRLLLAWNEAINLTGITEPALVATRHVLDSLTAVPLLADPGTSGRIRILDIGSGGGFPGLPLAAALPHATVTLLDSTAKKARFLETAVRATGLTDRVEVWAARAEALAGTRGAMAGRPWDVVTARAVGPLDRLIELAFPLLRAGGRLLAWKGADIDAELAAGSDAAIRLGGARPVMHPARAVAGLEAHRIVEVMRLRPASARAAGPRRHAEDRPERSPSRSIGRRR